VVTNNVVSRSICPASVQIEYGASIAEFPPDQINESRVVLFVRGQVIDWTMADGMGLDGSRGGVFVAGNANQCERSGCTACREKIVTGF